jgi:hypothetical protein
MISIQQAACGFALAAKSQNQCESGAERETASGVSVLFQRAVGQIVTSRVIITSWAVTSLAKQLILLQSPS